MSVMLINRDAANGTKINTDKISMDGSRKRYALFWLCAAYLLFLFLKLFLLFPIIPRFCQNYGCARTLSMASTASLRASSGFAAPVMTFSNMGIITSLSIWLARAYPKL